MARFSRRVRLANTIRPSGTWQSPRATMRVRRQPGDVFVAEFDPPDWARNRPEIVRSVVVLPAPFAPRRVTIAPAGT